ncbi:hypothetical protein TSUD_336430 [Trifolium subterraneum]|uniref:MSP domain-containing protein n=1 Tax=Trifolium subterraneum TaxID=3900 RepID=A0A2Z6LRG6_TRISU|nr:hypothetical protein TSUD_336430 [Trifolium subterraneum]
MSIYLLSLLNIFLLIPSLNLTEIRTVKAEAFINLHDLMAANISVSETGYLLTLYNNAAKVVDMIIWPYIVYQSRVQCAVPVESHFQLPWQKLQLIRVPIPLTGVHDVEVPYMREKFTLLVSSGRSTGPSSSKFNPSKWPCCGVYVRFQGD